MAGLEPTLPREPLHTRRIEVRGYRREDGLFDIEGHLVDTKPYDFKLAAGVRRAGEPIHDMWLRITVDRALTIVEAAAAMDAVPYAGECDRIAPAYLRLVGLGIRPGYQQRVKELLAGTRGCTHVTELALALATAAFQTMAGQRLQPAEQKPFQLDRCHALASDAPAVARYYPRWYTGKDVIDPVAEDHH
ncbi:MAG TPA: DUF2889 domain-containing protein [Usitatibacter sp.]|nr:DUF2889 domain-containing protein [Usitatibacter sp.]